MAAKAYFYCPVYYYRYNIILQYTYSVFLSSFFVVVFFFYISLHDLQFVKYLAISLNTAHVTLYIIESIDSRFGFVCSPLFPY